MRARISEMPRASLSARTVRVFWGYVDACRGNPRRLGQRLA